jgi:hypothetical protein
MQLEFLNVCGQASSIYWEALTRSSTYWWFALLWLI